MDITALVTLLPFLGSLGLSLGVLLFAWMRRDAKGAKPFIWYVGGQTLWIFGFIAEMTEHTISAKIFWDGMEWVGAVILIIAFPFFVVEYAEYRIKNPRRMFSYSLVVPIMFLLLIITNPFHHLIYANPRIISDGIFSELLYDFTPAVIFFSIYSYVVFLLGLSLLALRFISPHNLYRAQIAAIGIGFLIPVIGTILALFNVPITSQRDPAPFTAAIGNIILVLGLYRFRIFEVVPIVRDKVFEAMVEPVVILDNQNLIVDINTSMLDLLGRKAFEVIGEPAKKIFADFPIPIKMYTHVSYARAEANFEVAGKKVYYEMTVWPLYDKRRSMIGRIYISHDITALKELEQNLRELNTDLEKRVRARTLELAEAYDTTLEGWARTLELRDKETEGHSRRVTEITIRIARTLGISEEEIEHIRRGAILHDIGKMAIPDEILHKRGQLTVEERSVIEQHPDTARQLLEPIPFLRKALDIPYCHHEKWDGSGYPQKLRQREIPIAARIFAVVDVWDAVQSERPYKKGWTRAEAIEYIKQQSGCYFDPRIIDVFMKLVERGEI